MRLWVMCGDAPYRLPMAVADSCKELSEMTGVAKNYIRATAWKVKSGQQINGRFETVEIDDED